MALLGTETEYGILAPDAAGADPDWLAGLVVDVHMQVKFSRGADGTTQPKITKQSSEISVRDEPDGDGG